MLISVISLLEEELHENHIVVSCIVKCGNKVIKTYALIDSGAFSYAFIDSSFVQFNDLALDPLQTPCTLEVFDGQPVSSGDITHTVTMNMSMHDHHECKSKFFVTRLSHYPIVLEIP